MSAIFANDIDESLETTFARDYSEAVAVADDLRNQPSKIFSSMESFRGTGFTERFNFPTIKETGTSYSVGWMSSEKPTNKKQNKDSPQYGSFRDDEKLQELYRKGFIKLLAGKALKREHSGNDPRGKEPMAERILRSDFVKRLVPALNKLSEKIKEPSGARVVRNIFITIQQASSIMPNAAFTRFLLALYDSLAYENLWTRYSSEQYKKASEIMLSLAAYPYVNDNQVNRAIVGLESLGFNTMPFGFGAEAQHSAEQNS
jgi:hypothetical protein